MLTRCLADLLGGRAPPHNVALTGPRGTGKTVLLNWFKRACRDRESGSGRGEPDPGRHPDPRRAVRRSDAAARVAKLLPRKLGVAAVGSVEWAPPSGGVRNLQAELTARCRKRPRWSAGCGTSRWLPVRRWLSQTDVTALAPSRPPPPLSRGSSRPRMASPNMFRLYTTRVRQRPGHRASHGACSMYRRPSQLSRVPQLGVSGGRPNPRKLREASLIIAPRMLMLKMMISGATILGRTWCFQPARDAKPRQAVLPGRATWG